MSPGWSMPTLEGVTKTYVACPAGRVAARIGAALLEAGIARAADWQAANGDTHEFIRSATRAFVDRNGGPSIRKLFRLHLQLDAEPFWLTVEPSEAAYFVAGPTLDILERVHARLPATFFRLLTGALNRWIRIYDHEDAHNHVEMLHDWYDGDPEGVGVEYPNVEADTPRSLSERPLRPRELRAILPSCPPNVQEWMTRAIELDRLSRRQPHPRMTERTEEALSDCNPPLPSLLIVFKPGDNIEACFDAEALGMMEVQPEPNLILPCDDLRAAFRTLRTACQTLAKAAELIALLPEATNGM
ncbi:MAG: hypothetical protein R2729_15945 [Bryobacteraceae bacterium]